MKFSESRAGVLDMVSDAVILVDADRSVTYMNPSAEKLTGRHRDESLGKDLWLVCPVLHRDSREPVIKCSAEPGMGGDLHPLPFASVLVRESGEDLPVTGDFICFRGEEGGYLKGLVFREAGTRWFLDRSLLGLQRADTLKVIARGVSANISDLLTVLLARLSSIAREHGDRSSVLRHIRECRKTVGRISTIAADLVRQEEISSVRDICSLEKVLERSAALFRSSCNGPELEISLGPGTGFVAVPAILMEQLIMDLLMNAGDASDPGGTVIVTACRVAVADGSAGKVPGEYVMLDVTDRGIGMSQEQMIRAFDPFRGSSRDRFGLGLSAVYSIATEFKGYLSVDSTPGYGSSFTVLLPCPPEIMERSAGDTPVRIIPMGLEEEDLQHIRPLLDSLGCLEAGDLGNENHPSGEGEAGQTLDIVLTTQDHILSRGENFDFRLPSRGIDPKGTIVMMPSLQEPESDYPSGVVSVEAPLSMEKLARALGRLAWGRVPEAGEEADRAD